MTRKEQIQQEAKIRFPDNPIAQSRFKDGAEWSDANPNEANIAMYLGKKGWPLSTYGIPTYEEATKTLDEYYEYKRKQWFEQACKWFKENFMNGHKWEISTYEFENIQSMVDEFRKYME